MRHEREWGNYEKPQHHHQHHQRHDVQFSLIDLINANVLIFYIKLLYVRWVESLCVIESSFYQSNKNLLLCLCSFC